MNSTRTIMKATWQNLSYWKIYQKNKKELNGYYQQAKDPPKY